ncbi:ABC transporter substrate-binding protein [Salinispira pacifica]|uniref:ABC transporter substrate-binding protein n=1 Tax=Salinispira pacifica TaxID=1307761 RepID=V5WLR4_9SPIO|nr:ABC transporter substrate-binding protein [Salinispira pacifica]AHC16026.1 ABC transporter substrate-binding protein [Salinispira pacifica]
MKIFTIRTAAVLAAVVLLFSGCAGEQKSVTIGISKIVEHPALNAVEQGIKDEMAELGYDDISFDVQNAAGDMNTAGQIASKFLFDDVDIAVGIATPTSIALATAITDRPVIFTAVTDPVDAGLVDNLESGKNNVTGVSDLTPVAEQIDLIIELTGAQSIGTVYTSGEPNAVKLAELAEEAAANRGLEFVSTTIADSGQVKQAAEAIMDRVDAVYVSTDNTVFSALPALIEVANQNNVPVITADPSSFGDYDVLAAYGFDYYAMGRATGRLIDEVLEGSEPADIPTRFLTDPEDLLLVLNLDVADRLGIEVSDELVEQAGSIIRNGEVE